MLEAWSSRIVSLNAKSSRTGSLSTSAASRPGSSDSTAAWSVSRLAALFSFSLSSDASESWMSRASAGDDGMPSWKATPDGPRSRRMSCHSSKSSDTYTDPSLLPSKPLSRTRSRTPQLSSLPPSVAIASSSSSKVAVMMLTGQWEGPTRTHATLGLVGVPAYGREAKVMDWPRVRAMSERPASLYLEAACRRPFSALVFMSWDSHWCCSMSCRCVPCSPKSKCSSSNSRIDDAYVNMSRPSLAMVCHCDTFLARPLMTPCCRYVGAAKLSMSHFSTTATCSMVSQQQYFNMQRSIRVTSRRPDVYATTLSSSPI
mmetsp:Transcript_21841/g.62159  ORF Transcript_21841/g.62159 Transcript_21841/m.62159 type:complete len:315 (-) Transcript_21841:1117-2061(-)